MLAGAGACSGVTGTDVPTADVGDCVTDDVTATGEGVDEFDVVECTEPHTAEVFHTFELPDGDFPGDQALTQAMTEACGPVFEEYIGTAYGESEVEVYPVFPTEQTWDDADDREVICFGALRDGSELTESLEGSGR